MLKQQKSFEERTLIHDINSLLAIFNQVDEDNDGYISKSELTIIFNKLSISTKQYQYVSLFKNQNSFEFDDMLSILGLIQMPQEPSVYVLNFVRILAKYRNKCLERSQTDQKILKQAKDIGDRIKKIIRNEMQRQKQRIISQHDKIYEEMDRTQQNQFNNFQQDWKRYLQQFKAQTQQKIIKTKTQKLREFSSQSQKLAKTARRHSLVTSTKLRELMDKKKWLVKEGKYGQAIKINYLIDIEKKKIQEYQQETLTNALRKRMQSLKKKNNNALDNIQASMSINMKKLMAKKKEGENLMQLRMKNLREEAEKKLNDHLRGQLNRLKTLFTRAAK